jgi:hypothetical protein
MKPAPTYKCKDLIYPATRKYFSLRLREHKFLGAVKIYRKFTSNPLICKLFFYFLSRPFGVISLHNDALTYFVVAEIYFDFFHSFSFSLLRSRRPLFVGSQKRVYARRRMKKFNLQIAHQTTTKLLRMKNTTITGLP